MQSEDQDDGTVVTLTAAGVAVLIDIGGDALPAVPYWGADLGAPAAAGAAALVAATVPVAGVNNLDDPPRVGVLREHRTGWTGRPGLSGSYAGVGWSPAFAGTGVTVRRRPVGGVVEVEAVDDAGRLGLRLT